MLFHLKREESKKTKERKKETRRVLGSEDSITRKREITDGCATKLPATLVDIY